MTPTIADIKKSHHAVKKYLDMISNPKTKSSRRNLESKFWDFGLRDASVRLRNAMQVRDCVTKVRDCVTQLRDCVTQTLARASLRVAEKVLLFSDYVSSQNQKNWIMIMFYTHEI